MTGMAVAVAANQAPTRTIVDWICMLIEIGGRRLSFGFGNEGHV